MSDDRSIPQKIVEAPGLLLGQMERAVGRRYYRRYFANRPAHTAVDANTISARMQDADHILFLCLGNVCRSPFAAQYAATHLDTVDVASAGLSPLQGIDSPANAVRTARTFGVDLSEHTSRGVPATALQETDMVFVMDFCNYYLLSTRHPAARDRAHFLGALNPERTTPVIPDPHGGDPETFRETYAAISRTIDRLAAIMCNEQNLQPDPR